MTTLRKRVEQAAFWGGQVCLSCGYTTHEEDSEEALCLECGVELVSAETVDRFLFQVEADEDE